MEIIIDLSKFIVRLSTKHQLIWPAIKDRIIEAYFIIAPMLF